MRLFLSSRIFFAAKLICFLWGALAFSADPDPGTDPVISESDLAPLIQALKPYTYVNKKPVFVYHWFNAQTSSKFAQWTAPLSPSDPIGYQYVKSVSTAYWTNFNPGHTGTSMYGSGLYAAMDPVASFGFGGVTDWVLVQMRLPSGFRTIDLLRDGMNSLPMDVVKVLTKLGCPETLLNGSNALGNIMNPHSTSDPKCRAAIRKILKDHFKMDGFVYSYNATPFTECNPPVDSSSSTSLGMGMGMSGMYGANPLRNGAFVITDSSSLKPEDVRVFNAKTTEAPEDRLRIQSMFYKADADQPQQQFVDINQLYQAYPAYNGWMMSGYSYGCPNGAATCAIQVPTTVVLCPNPNPVTSSTPPSGGASTSIIASASVPAVSCVTLPYPQNPTNTASYPTQITAAHLPHSQIPSAGQKFCAPNCTLLWGDLEGKQTDPDLGSWIKGHLYQCGSGPQYISTLDFESILRAECLKTNGSLEQDLEKLLNPVSSALTKLH